MRTGEAARRSAPESGESPDARTGITAWLLRHRANARLAFGLRTLSLGVAAVAALVWARLLVGTLGVELYGLFLAFVAISQLGGLGDFGLAGAVGIRMSGMLARREDEAGRRFLANARGVFLVLAGALFLLVLAASPWLPELFRFAPLPGAGSLPLLFAIGGAGVGLLVLGGYISNLNYIHGNLVWPIVPTLVLTQLTFAGQWLLASTRAPLWAQYSVQVATSAVALGLGWWMLRVSHPWLGELRPVRFDRAEGCRLGRTSVWAYFATLGSLIYTTTDSILINAGFGSSALPAYRFNYKLCELCVTLLGSMSFVALPAIVARLLGADEMQRSFGLSGVERLQRFQVVAATAAGLGYLCVNDWFIRLWVGPAFQVPLALQVAFALNLAITISGDIGIQLIGRLHQRGLRLAALTIAGTGLLNLALSLVAVRLGSILGIAVATVIAQSVSSLILSRATSRAIGLDSRRWAARAWLFPFVVVALGGTARWLLPPDSFAPAVALVAICIALLATLAWLAGIPRRMLLDEWERLRAPFR